MIICFAPRVGISCPLGETYGFLPVAREQYDPVIGLRTMTDQKEECYSVHHMDASTLHSDEGRSQLRKASVSR